jgi:hypothetical protein
MSHLEDWHISPGDSEGSRPGEVPELLQLLGRGTLGDTWIAHEEGTWLAAKRLHLLPPRKPDEVRDALQPLTSLRDPALLVIRQIVATGDNVWVCSEFAAGVPLHRLLVVAALTPTQVAMIVEGVCLGLGVLHRAGLCHGALHAHNVHVSPDGTIRLGDAGIAFLMAAGDRSRRQVGWSPENWIISDGVAAAALFRRALDTGHRAGSAWRSSRALALAEAIEVLGRARNPSEVEMALESLQQAAANCLEDRRATVSAELGALVRRLEPSPALPRLEPLGPSKPMSALDGPASGEDQPVATPSSTLRPRSRGVQYAAALMAAALVLAGAVAVRWMHGLVTRPSPRSSVPPAVHASAPPSVSSPTPVPVPTPQPVPVLAPDRAGPITAVELQPLGNCSPGAQCAVRVTVRLVPSATRVPLAWSFEVFDRCTGSLTELPGAQMSADPGWNYAYDTSYPTLPDGRGLAVVAVTSEPARAASAPWLVPAGEPTC